MIGIQLDGDTEFLETPPGVSISVRLENPVLSEADRISPGSYSFPFNLPGGDKSPKNAAKLKNPDVIENNEAYTIQKATLFCSSAPDSNVVPFKKGNLKAQESAMNKINSYFTFGLNSISEEFKTAKLRDVISETFLISDSAIQKTIYVKRVTAGDYNITINGQSYTAADVDSIVIAINANFDASLDSGIYMPRAGKITAGTSPTGLITGTYFQLKLARYDTLGSPTMTFSTDPLREMSINTDSPADYLVESDLGTYFSEFDTFLADYIAGTFPNDKIRFPVCFNGNPYNEALKEGEIVNGVNTGGLILNDPNWGLVNSKPFEIKNYNSILPVLRRKWILDKIATTFGFAWDGDFYEHTDMENMLEWNTAALDVPQPYIGSKKFVFWKRSFNLSELVPDITVVEYLKLLKNRYNLAIYFNELTQRVSMSQREKLATRIVYNDITSLCSPVTGNEDLRVMGYKVIAKKDDTDAMSFEETTVVGTAEKDIPIECGRLFQISGDIIETKPVTGPRVSQPWGSKGQLRTFYDTGMVDVTTFEYQGASINGTTITESLTTAVVGLYDSFWKYWLHYQKNTRVVKLKVGFPLRSLIAFDWELKRRFNRVNYLVKAIDLTITNQEVKVTNVELFSLQ